MKRSFVFVSAILVIAAGAAAQTAQTPEKARTVVTERVLVGEQGVSKPIFLLDRDGIGKPVKGAPYSANATTETTQTLSDGNRIVSRTTAFVARDSEGRTRREENFAKVGALEADAFKSVMITDPLAHTEYFAQPGAVGKDNAMVLNTEEIKRNKFFHRKSEVAGRMLLDLSGVAKESEDTGNVNHESLGTQVMEGMTVTGVRDTRTIPAGAIGNEKPIVITSEVWTSPDLQVVVFSRRNDPRFGETVYKLTDINRSEPDPALFQLPEKVKKDALPVK